MPTTNSPVLKSYDLCVIGGGINGVGIARDAAGRGLDVLLLEAGDLGGATSSASTKLVHGGLRYLEQYEFRLVAESLAERERLLKSAPHIISPLEFVLPYEMGLRPYWFMRLGLFLYDNLKKRTLLPSSKTRDLRSDVALKKAYKRGFSYSDCWVDDARLVILNARDAADKGADIRVRNRCQSLEPVKNNSQWKIKFFDSLKNIHGEVLADVVVNAGGPWVYEILSKNKLTTAKTPHIRLVKGSHVILPKMYEGIHAYILQQPDRRIVFAIPYEGDFTLIGTTDSIYEGDRAEVKISPNEIKYLCQAVNRSFEKQISPENIVWTYSGVRPLVDSGDDKLSEITRDYKLDIEIFDGSVLLNIFGGKITTYRKLSEHAVDLLKPHFKDITARWTERAILPGGDIEQWNFDQWLARQTAIYSWMPEKLLLRYGRAYGTYISYLLKDASSLQDLGIDYGDHVLEAEIRYLVQYEWARTVEDVLWRRTKLGLHVGADTIAALHSALPLIVKEFADA